ncbi:MAG: hypothetical protein R2864_06545 [Syntrophotaleaceae bacterium]
MTELEGWKELRTVLRCRQLIFDRAGNTWGYELLFRSGSGAERAEISDQDFATMCVATCGFIESQRHVDQTKKICINFTENLILQGAARGLLPSVAVVEVLETVVPTDRILEELIGLKQQGYLVAIDDYEGAALQSPLPRDIADIIKVDLLGKDVAWIADIYASIQDKNALKLAEKVDNRGNPGGAQGDRIRPSIRGSTLPSRKISAAGPCVPRIWPASAFCNSSTTPLFLPKSC